MQNFFLLTFEDLIFKDFEIMHANDSLTSFLRRTLGRKLSKFGIKTKENRIKVKIQNMCQKPKSKVAKLTKILTEQNTLDQKCGFASKKMKKICIFRVYHIKTERAMKGKIR